MFFSTQGRVGHNRWPPQQTYYCRSELLMGFPFGKLFECCFLKEGYLCWDNFLIRFSCFFDSCASSVPASLLCLLLRFSKFLLLCFSASPSFCFSCFFCFSAFPASVFFCFSAFLASLLFCFSAFPRFAFPASASVPFSLYLFFFCSHAFLLLYFFLLLLFCFLSLLPLWFSFYFALFSPVCILNKTLEKP